MALAKPTITRNTNAAEDTEVETVDTQAVQEMAQEAEAEAAEVAQADPVMETKLTAEQEERQEHLNTETTSQAVATRETATPAVKREASHPIASSGKFVETMVDMGFEGLRIDGFSFPTIILPAEGFFQFSDNEDSNLGKAFVFDPESSTSRWRVKESDDKDAEFFMSYRKDGLTKADGSDATAILRQWAADSGEEDYQPIIKEYLDVVATIVEADPSSAEAQELVGETVMLSIPYTSSSRFTGAFARGVKRGGLGSFYIEASVARKVKTDGGGFYPWQFKLV